MDNQKIGATIASLRNDKSMTQAELGERLGVSFQAVSKWERGETLPDVTLLTNLADALDTSVDYILRSGENDFTYKGKIKVSDMIEGLNYLKKFGEAVGTDNIIYRHAIDGINKGMNTDIEPAFRDDYIFEAFVAECVIQDINRGMYADVTDIKRSFKHEHFRNVVLAFAKKQNNHERNE